MGRWDKKGSTFGENESQPTDNELNQMKRLNIETLVDVDKYDKISGDGEIKRLSNTREFLKNPKEMRKYLRKKKSTKPKTKRKCSCKSK